jgi:hypothetical protein
LTNSRGPTVARRCAPALTKARTLRGIVAAYIRDHLNGAVREMRFYALQRTLAGAISCAASCKLPSGKRHPHQRRIPQAALTNAKRRLLSAGVGRVRTFDELHDVVASVIGPIRKIVPLAIYDMAHRIGAFLGVKPTRVYLHRGTREGARKLGLGWGRKTLDIGELPREFHRLTASEVEDCLCIYKGVLPRL